jgi:hypothetical protein
MELNISYAKNVLSYMSMFSMFINTYYGYPLLGEQYWYVAENVLDRVP